MPFNRINGFYFGKWSLKEFSSMTLDERNGEVNKALEVRFSQLNAALEAHEARLKSMMVPQDAWIEYDSTDNEDPHTGNVFGQYQSFIGMIKLRGTWRLCHADHYDNYSAPSEELEWKPIVEASIEDRINAAEHIEKLREAIVETKERLVPEVEKAIATLGQLLD